MNNPLRAFVALDAGVDRQFVETLITSSPRLSVLDYGEIDAAASGQDNADVLVVACTEYTQSVAEYISRASVLRSGRPIVLLARAAPNGYVADAFENGVEDIVTLPEGDDLQTAAAMAPGVVFALEKAVTRKRGTRGAVAQHLGETIVVLGLKGGSGKTLTTANLSVALADAGNRVAVVDLDLQFGDLGLALGLSPTRTMYDLSRAGGSMDAEKVEDFMEVHPSGVRALLAPTRPDRAGAITTDFLRDVYQVLSEAFDFVLIDTPPGFTPEVIAAVDTSTSVCMVAMLDSLSLKNTKVGLETLELMEYDTSKIRLVLNRADSKVGIAAEDVVALMGRTPSVLVPSDRNVTRSVNKGEPIALSNRRSDAARAFHALAGLYIEGRAGDETTNGAKTRRRLFRRR
jgi:pilus assembly protein CpaE